MGVISRQQLLGHDLASSSIAQLRSSGQLTTLSAGVYLVRGAPLVHAAQLWAAVLSTDGVLGYASAVSLWDLPVAVAAEPIRVIIGRHDRCRAIPTWVRLTRSDLPSCVVVERHGLPVTDRAWTLTDHLSTLDRRAGVELLDRALQRRWLTRRDLDWRLEEFPTRRGNSAIRALRRATADGAAAESERRLHRILQQADISGWTANFAVRAGGELIAVVDIAFPALRLAIEVDGMAHHVDVERFRGDRRRQNRLVLLGWTVLRFTWADLSERPDDVVNAVRRAAA